MGWRWLLQSKVRQGKRKLKKAILSCFLATFGVTRSNALSLTERFGDLFYVTDEHLPTGARQQCPRHICHVSLPTGWYQLAKKWRQKCSSARRCTGPSRIRRRRQNTLLHPARIRQCRCFIHHAVSITGVVSAASNTGQCFRDTMIQGFASHNVLLSFQMVKHEHTRCVDVQDW